MSALFPAADRSAVLSDCERYRYRLTRTWGLGRGTVCWVMLNPSTADAAIDDPTIRRCIGFSRAWGYGSLSVVNLYALRATDPADLAGPADPYGPENDAHIFDALCRADLAICAWGATPGPRKGFRVERILTLAQDAGQPLHALGLTKAGDPRHPLYLRRDAKPVRWEAA